MSFLVDQSPDVERALSRCSPAQRAFFREVRSILADNPFRFRELIHKNYDGNGRVFYQYYDGIIPLVFFYRTHPSEEQWSVGEPGYVFIA